MVISIIESLAGKTTVRIESKYVEAKALDNAKCDKGERSGLDRLVVVVGEHLDVLPLLAEEPKVGDGGAASDTQWIVDRFGGEGVKMTGCCMNEEPLNSNIWRGIVMNE